MFYCLPFKIVVLDCQQSPIQQKKKKAFHLIAIFAIATHGCISGRYVFECVCVLYMLRYAFTLNLKAMSQ